MSEGFEVFPLGTMKGISGRQQSIAGRLQDSMAQRVSLVAWVISESGVVPAGA